MLVTLDGIIIVVRLLHPFKRTIPNAFNTVWNNYIIKATASLKHTISDVGNTITDHNRRKVLQLLNIPFPMVVTLSGSTTDL